MAGAKRSQGLWQPGKRQECILPSQSDASQWWSRETWTLGGLREECSKRGREGWDVAGAEPLPRSEFDQAFAWSASLVRFSHQPSQHAYPFFGLLSSRLKCDWVPWIACHFSRLLHEHRKRGFLKHFRQSEMHVHLKCARNVLIM